MKKITLTNPAQKNTTVLENEFIDQYMAKANGEYVKVYLLLLRHFGETSKDPAVSEIADFLEMTEGDIIRALNYWKRAGLLDYDLSEAKPAEASEYGPAMAMPDRFGDCSVEEPPRAEPVSDIQQFRSRKEFQELIFVAEQYLCKTLSSTEVDAITYFYDTLQMSADLIEYLIEYCVENGHRSIRYIQKVALSWHEQHITTAEQAKYQTMLYNKSCFSVLNAFGIKGRAPAPPEVDFIKRWTDEYGFSLDIILEACRRTMANTHQPSFEYTDSILKSWMQHHVHTLAEVSALDADYLQEKEKKNKRNAKPSPAKASTKFNNFDSRSYDMDDLERRLVQQ